MGLNCKVCVACEGDHEKEMMLTKYLPHIHVVLSDLPWIIVFPNIKFGVSLPCPSAICNAPLASPVGVKLFRSPPHLNCCV